MSTQSASDRPPKVTTQTVVEMKQQKEKISMLTAYDFTMAKIVDQAGIDVILVGDSASNVMAGHETTVPMTMDHMLYHASCVVRAVDRALVIADLPFMSYQVTAKEALISSGRMMKEAGVHGVKLEGGSVISDTIKRIVDAGIPVMGHLGLTPQSIYKFGTYKVRAKEEAEAEPNLHPGLRRRSDLRRDDVRLPRRHARMHAGDVPGVLRSRRLRRQRVPAKRNLRALP
jgi:3-methyl-2-oxobutanoate hydroxymethyltransferase